MDKPQDVIKCKIGFIGGGNMAKAICEGIVRKGTSNYVFTQLLIIKFLRSYQIFPDIRIRSSYRKLAKLEMCRSQHNRG